MNLKESIRKILREEISAKEAYNEYDSIKTIIDGKRDVAFTTLENPTTKFLIFINGLKKIKVESEDETNYIVYKKRSEDLAKELFNIANKYGGKLRFDATEEDSRRIGQILNYNPKEIEDYISHNKKIRDLESDQSEEQIQESIRRILREDDYSPAGKEITPNDIVVHKSNPMFRDKIMSEGLKVKAGECYKIYVGYGTKCKPAIFATNSTNKRAWFDSTYDDDIWFIDTTKIPDVKWFKDRHFESTKKHIVTFQDIPSEALTLHYEGTGSGDVKKWGKDSPNLFESIRRILREENKQPFEIYVDMGNVLFTTTTNDEIQKSSSEKPKDVKSFQNWVINTKKDNQILGKFGADGIWGKNTSIAWLKYGEEYKKTNSNVETIQPKKSNFIGSDLWNNIRNLDTKILTAIGNSNQEQKKLNKLNQISKNNLGISNDKVLFVTSGIDKKNYSGPNKILIDDSKQNILNWESKGGIGILHRNNEDTIAQLNQYLTGNLQESIRKLLREETIDITTILRRIHAYDLEREFSESLDMASNMFFNLIKNGGGIMDIKRFIDVTTSILMDGIHHDLISSLPFEYEWYNEVQEILKDYYKDRIEVRYKKLISKM